MRGIVGGIKKIVPPYSEGQGLAIFEEVSGTSLA
jgi:hypothetical protein